MSARLRACHLLTFARSPSRTGCALTSSQTPYRRRVFSPEPESEPTCRPRTSGPALSFGSVKWAASYLEERISYRLQPRSSPTTKIGSGPKRREYLRRALERELLSAVTFGASSRAQARRSRSSLRPRGVAVHAAACGSRSVTRSTTTGSHRSNGAWWWNDPSPPILGLIALSGSPLLWRSA